MRRGDTIVIVIVAAVVVVAVSNACVAGVIVCGVQIVVQVCMRC